MTEEELARYYEERKGDLSQWETKPRKIRVRRGGPSTVFSMRFAPEELKVAQDAAGRLGVTVSEFIRRSALEAAQGRRDGSVRLKSRVMLEGKEPNG